MEILFSDKHIVLVNKPSGLSSQDVPDGGDCLPARLAEAGMPVKTIHRLDKDTTGVMVYARTQEAAGALSAMVGRHDVFEKTYLAVIQGCPQEQTGTFTDLLFHDRQRNKSFVVQRERKGVRLASLSYEVLQTISGEMGTLSLVSVRLHTGRTHQIRVQFASRGMPLVGDSRYGGLRTASLALHSHRLAFPHPITQESMSVVSMPDYDARPWNLFNVPV